VHVEAQKHDDLRPEQIGQVDGRRATAPSAQAIRPVRQTARLEGHELHVAIERQVRPLPADFPFTSVQVQPVMVPVEPALIGPEKNVCPRAEINACIVDVDHLAATSQPLDVEALERRPATKDECRLTLPSSDRNSPRRHFRTTLRTSALPASSAAVLTMNFAALAASDADRDCTARLIASRRS